MGRLHISLDDVKGIFKVLAEDSMDSIFETRTLAFLNKMHELYGMQIGLFCTVIPDQFRIKMGGNPLIGSALAGDGAVNFLTVNNQQITAF